jgi:hypothetical protein
MERKTRNGLAGTNNLREQSAPSPGPASKGRENGSGFVLIALKTSIQLACRRRAVIRGCDLAHTCGPTGLPIVDPIIIPYLRALK